MWDQNKVGNKIIELVTEKIALCDLLKGLCLAHEPDLP